MTALQPYMLGFFPQSLFQLLFQSAATREERVSPAAAQTMGPQFIHTLSLVNFMNQKIIKWPKN